MATVTPGEVRQRIATQVAGITNWYEDPAPIDIFGRGPRPLQHLLFAVGVGVTRNTQGMRDRASSVILVNTGVTVRFSYSMSPKDLKTSFDGALTAEMTLIQRLMRYDNTPWPGDLQVLYDGSSRQYGDEYTIIDINFSILHTLQI